MTLSLTPVSPARIGSVPGEAMSSSIQDLMTAALVGGFLLACLLGAAFLLGYAMGRRSQPPRPEEVAATVTLQEGPTTTSPPKPGSKGGGGSTRGECGIPVKRGADDGKLFFEYWSLPGGGAAHLEPTCRHIRNSVLTRQSEQIYVSCNFRVPFFWF